MTDKKEMTFEDAYEELSTLIDQLEAGQQSLDESMALYERGRTLIELCDKLLSAAELRVNQISSDGSGGVKLERLS